MKVLVLSDIHSNLPALEAIWAQDGDCDAVFCAGDLVDYGPFPCEVIDWICSHGAGCVQGNHDLNVVQSRRAEPAFAELPVEERVWRHHNAALLRPGDVDFLAGLPRTLRFDLDGVRYGMAHAYRGYDLIDDQSVLAGFLESAFAPEGGTVDRLVLGHTHVAGVRRFDSGKLWLNPGSASYGRGSCRDRWAHYCTITDGVIALRQTAFDHRPMLQCLDRFRLMQPEEDAVRRMFGEMG